MWRCRGFYSLVFVVKMYNTSYIYRKHKTLWGHSYNGNENKLKSVDHFDIVTFTYAHEIEVENKRNERMNKK